MALFDRRGSADEEFVASSDVATRALSVTAVENDFVAGVYEKLASVYDIVFGPTLHRGPRRRRSSGWRSRQAIACSKSASAPAST